MTLDERTEDDLSLTLCKEEGCNKKKGHSGKCLFFKTSMIDDLPGDVVEKIRKTGYTRGANMDRTPYQNRVKRHNRTVVPFDFRDKRPKGGYQDGLTIMVRPKEYFDPDSGERRDDFPNDVVIGDNAFIYYEYREDWENYPPEDYDWRPCSYLDSDGNSTSDLRGEVSHTGDYIARIPARASDEKIIEGKVQGIRFFEYATTRTVEETSFQLAYLAWKTEGMEELAGREIPEHLVAILQENDLASTDRLEKIDAIENGTTICPLCREPVKSMSLVDRVSQTEGRESSANRITKANLFHVDELRPGEFNHKPYNLAWGHHHCNMVVGDDGVEGTLDWIEEVLQNNDRI